MMLREYQQRAVAEVRAALSRNRSVVLALQVGGGKTVIACDIIKRAVARGRRALFVVHRVELVEQAKARLAAFGVKAGVIKAGYPETRSLPVQVACVPTMVRREFFPAELVVMDEAHHAVSASWMKVIGHYRASGAWILGITATPLRLDGKPLGGAFDEIVEPVSTRDLIRDGFLIEPTVYAPPFDASGLKTRGGDYSIPELAERVAPLCGSIVKTWMARARGQRTLAFAVNVEHSNMIREAFGAVGVRAVHIDGNSRALDRGRANRKLRSGEVDVVTQCQVWTEGVDIPELGCLIVARPTKSLSLHRQMVGRVMRPAPGKTEATVLDHAGNHHEHGAVSADIEWSLDERPKSASTAEPVRTCPECFAVVPVGARECPQCGAELLSSDTAQQPGVENPGELVRVDLKPKPKATQEEKARVYADLIETASERTYRLGWARMRYKDQFGVWPRFRAMERERYRCPGHEWEPAKYGARDLVRCSRCFEESA